MTAIARPRDAASLSSATESDDGFDATGAAMAAGSAVPHDARSKHAATVTARVFKDCVAMGSI
jgi:hypothetical protein